MLMSHMTKNSPDRASLGTLLLLAMKQDFGTPNAEGHAFVDRTYKQRSQTGAARFGSKTLRKRNRVEEQAGAGRTKRDEKGEMAREKK